MSKNLGIRANGIRANRLSGRKAWVNVLLRAGDHGKAQAYARKHGLSEWFASVQSATIPQGTITVMSTSEGCATLSPSPTLSEPQALAQPGTPGGAGVDETPRPKNEDQSRPSGKNSQLEVAGLGGAADNAAVGGAPLAAPGWAWPDAEDGEPEMLAALAQASGGANPQGAPSAKADSQCATPSLTEAGRQVASFGAPAAPYGQSFSALGGLETESARGRVGEEARQKVPVELDVRSTTEPISVPDTERADSASQIEGWPEESDAWVVRELPNPRLLLVKLPNGRMASCWRAGRRWVPKTPVRVKLEKRTGDVIYQPV